MQRPVSLRGAPRFYTSVDSILCSLTEGCAGRGGKELLGGLTLQVERIGRTFGEEVPAPEVLIDIAQN